jgi:hypothetical protein
MNQQEIEEQAKQIMDSFLAELGSVGEPKHFGLVRERGQQVRQPAVKDCDERFRQLLFSNAPKLRDGLLVMERKTW